MLKWLPALVAALCLYTLPAKSAGAFSPGEERLLEALNKAGVEIVIEPCETPGYYGAYSAKFNELYICTNTIGGISQFWETMRHEAIHVAQRCVDPGMSETVHSKAYLEHYGHDADAKLIMATYDKEDWAIEVEAFTLMRRSNDFVADVVIKACNL